MSGSKDTPKIDKAGNEYVQWNALSPFTHAIADNAKTNAGNVKDGVNKTTKDVTNGDSGLGSMLGGIVDWISNQVGGLWGMLIKLFAGLFGFGGGQETAQAPTSPQSPTAPQQQQQQQQGPAQSQNIGGDIMNYAVKTAVDNLPLPEALSGLKTHITDFALSAINSPSVPTVQQQNPQNQKSAQDRAS